MKMNTRKRYSNKSNKKNKTRMRLMRNGINSSPFLTGVVLHFLEYLLTIKMSHWNTHQYGVHKALDEIYSTMNDLIDKFVETLLGKTNNRIHTNMKHGINLKINNYNDTQEIKKQVKDFIEFMSRLDIEKLTHRSKDMNSDLYNLRDEMISENNKLLYLLTLQ